MRDPHHRPLTHRATWRELHDAQQPNTYPRWNNGPRRTSPPQRPTSTKTQQQQPHWRKIPRPKWAKTLQRMVESKAVGARQIEAIQKAMQMAEAGSQKWDITITGITPEQWRAIDKTRLGTQHKKRTREDKKKNGTRK